jgi:hypothetical protein
MSSGNTKSTLQEKQSGLDDLVWEMRRDLKIKPSEKESEFQMLLWTSGKKPEK